MLPEYFMENAKKKKGSTAKLPKYLPFLARILLILKLKGVGGNCPLPLCLEAPGLEPAPEPRAEAPASGADAPHQYLYLHIMVLDNVMKI